MAKLPPTPVGVPPGHSFWNDWYEKLRDLINNGAVATSWALLDFSGSNITDIVNRAHNNLQSIQGGTAGEYNHLTNAQHTAVINNLPASGTYTPTLTNVANLDGSTAYQAQYLRIGATVTVSGKVDVNPTLTATSTQLRISIPVASNFGAQEDCAGAAFSPAIAGMGAAILADTTNDDALLQFVSSDINNNSFYFTFSYQVI